MIRTSKVLAAASVLALGFALPMAAAQSAPSAAASAKAVYKDAGAPVEARVDDLLSRMTLDEKIAQITTVWTDKVKIFDDRLQLDPAKLAAQYPHGLGHFTRPSDAKGAFSPRVAPGRNPRQTVALVNALQKWATTQTRLGIPILFHEEGLHGYAAVGATSFPQSIAMASSFDTAMLRDVNSVIAREIRSRGVPMVLSPVVDIARDPRWGRIEETYGEDPYLVGEMGVAAVEGLQGVGRSRTLRPGKVFATLKHLTGHGQPESGTNIGPAPVSERELRENFFPPFEQVVKRTGIEAVMASYNEIDGVPSHANRWLLENVLREEWGFKGAVVSDYSAVDQLMSIHHIAANLEEAAMRALDAGVDADLPDGLSYATLGKLVREGKVSEAKVDLATRRMLELKFRAGLFENPYADAAASEKITNNADARALALKAAQRSITLLKNDGMLPLRPEGTIAVIGPSAAVARLGGYYGQPPHSVSILEGIKAKVGGRANIVFAQGVKITEDDDWWADSVTQSDPAENRKLIAQAVEAARGVDRIVLTLGDTEQSSREGWADNHLGDRPSLDLVGEQQALFDALKALGKPITVVLINGRPASTVTISEQANAILEGWYLGEQGGNAVADILFGDVNPGGKLPVTVPRSVGQLPMFYNVKPSARRGYLFDTTDPLYPFGFGLSYTSFALSPPRLAATTIGTGGKTTVSVDVRNSGAREGDEVVQLYIRDKVSSVTRPVKELKGFQRVTLKPGEVRTVTFTIDPDRLQMWNDAMHRVVEPGDFEIMTGNSSVALQSATLTVTP
ncbi:glycoside hydrolase family 3 N-terminal domain-containing protein [Sphingobium sp. CR2-8]|uniref:glycoside hydrolase family 3 N-terminal domain-containing protein n=1 Tax=Sphingobium sp. CR2-8 TaxID=1306534 RepID=UPI002DB70B34|nr:glycoside hydrolase family 3 N-terminal domain-containing protein [Sphingobium sp. CR2-8]MEC3911572.1 glycoside hydrolase family 3 N-terminal domain-containing protein [Sphingobium sp. CR2-8]